MTGWSTHEGIAIAFDRESVDTDQLIPARFMSTPRSEGYGDFLLHDMRYDGEGRPRPEFPLNRHPEVSVLVTRRNFGSGSSREAAVYALVDFGIRAVIAPSFGDIFASNAVNNGLLPARVDADTVDALIGALGEGEMDALIDLATSTLKIGESTLPFDLDPVWREKLIEGWDDIDLTLKYRNEIASFRRTIEEEAHWRLPAGAG
ncbi:3-isopropylmalate dehydratase small subunit [Ovoidimarina sediminis]|uniref:3-isopropylmalate dehydratase small subunit n=1 Tax=Ovoidimarina sediminis TaxID=3079856 RepID=UPI002912C70B|nr:3-isopropylmalate dehydratase small subunit [Rhodophyticola sp. MJ-SS7]MDU8946260.1 3-isopropylmalate dehydratase small subunit [Rhodophyticola sp. MJ-SS7]